MLPRFGEHYSMNSLVFTPQNAVSIVMYRVVFYFVGIVYDSNLNNAYEIIDTCTNLKVNRKA